MTKKDIELLIKFTKNRENIKNSPESRELFATIIKEIDSKVNITQ